MKGQTGEGALGEEEANKAYEEERQVRLGSAGKTRMRVSRRHGDGGEGGAGTMGAGDGR